MSAPDAAPALLSSALKYAAHGWHVFPCWWPVGSACACVKGPECDRPGKHPLARLAPNGLLDATMDEAIVRGWWTQYPLANIGIRCGEPSGLVVLDIDAYKGGMFSFEDLEARHGTVPYSIRAKTGSGGGSAHVYLGHPKDGRRISSNASGKLGSGLDVKADGGYVIAPPSLHASGGRYLWLDVDNSQIEPAPSWLLGLLGTTNGTPIDPINTGIELQEEDAKKLADEWFARAASRVEGGAPRHDTWVWFAVQMKDSAVPLLVTAKYVDEYLKLAQEMGASRKVTERELVGALNWAYGKARRDPLPAARRALEGKKEAEGEEPNGDAHETPTPLCCPTIFEALNEPQPEQRWILKNLFPAGGIFLLASEGGIGKSTLLVQWVISIARGVPFLGFEPERAYRSLFLEAEGARSIWLDRVRVAMHHQGVEKGGLDLPLHVSPTFFRHDLRDPKFVESLVNTRPDLVVLDTVGLFHDGDENSNTDFKAKVVKPLRELGATVISESGLPVSWVLVHHQSKPSEMRQGRHTVRGASAMVDDSDLAARLEAPNGIRAHARRLVFDKVRYGAIPEPIQMHYDGATATFRMEEGAEPEAEDAGHRRAVNAAAERMFEVIRMNPNLTTAQIDQAMGKGRREVKLDARQLLQEQKRIFFDGKKGGSLRWYAGKS